MKPRFAAVLVALAGTIAFADDGPKPAAPPAKPDAAAAAPKARKTSPEAEAAIAKYAALLEFPNTKFKSLSLEARADFPTLGGIVGIHLAWSEDKPLRCKVELPEATRKAYPTQIEQMEKPIARAVARYFGAFLLSPTTKAKQYDLAARTKDGRTFVDVVRVGEDAEWDKATLEFAADGLLAKESGTLHIDPDDQFGQVNVGFQVEVAFAHAKRGDRFVVESAKIADAYGDSTVKVAYYDAPGAPALPKEVTVALPIFPEPLVVKISDWVVDGKPVAGTERKEEEKKPAAPAAGKDEKPAPPPKK